jgi:tRNA threonylcarbamoyladenosine biosynthesis protein TsaE
MSTHEKTFYTTSAEQTEGIASAIGAHLKGGECIELVSDLGGGKTTFTRGLVRGVGSFDQVSSPTFTIGKQYKSDGKTCYHFDFYRLQEPGLVTEELREATENPDGIIIVEWAQSVSDVLPEDRIIITIERVTESSESRNIRVQLHDKLKYILEGVS